MDSGGTVKNKIEIKDEFRREYMTLKGYATTKEEFLYPDSPLGCLPEQLRLVMARNGKPGIQVLLETLGQDVEFVIEGTGFQTEWYQMKAVPVEYNTGDGVSQGGGMVLQNPPEEKPEYVTRLAPFRVYDCLRSIKTGRVQAEEGRAAVYFCFTADKDILPGEHTLKLRAEAKEGSWECRLLVHVYDVMIPQDAFPVTNWFSLEDISRFHYVEMGTPEYIQVLRKYIRAMRRLHQNVFYIQLDEKCVTGEKPWTFDFEYLTPVIESFFAEGMEILELGALLHRGFRPDGSPDMYTDSFTCMMKKNLKFDTLEGYEHTVRLVQALASYLKKHGWDKKVLFHIHDEPDIHFRDQQALESRRRQYYLAASILRKYLPGVRIIEAVDTAGFFGGVDIWVPGTAGYEKRKEEFDTLIGLGETVWTYVCCGPEGKWLNRFLDFHLMRGRLLFWGCARNRISGFLHWGFNQFPGGMDPLKGTSCPNDTGIGTNFPCGDSFLVYPGENGSDIGMRLEAQRRGAEDAALWGLLRKKDEALHDRLLDQMFTNNYTYCNDPEELERVFELLLESLEDTAIQTDEECL